MEKVIDRPGGVFGHCILQLRQGGRFDIFDALKRLEQLSPPLLPHAGDLVEHRAAHPLVLLLAVELDGKAVGLLLDLADEGEDGLVSLDADLLSLGGCLLYTSDAADE